MDPNFFAHEEAAGFSRGVPDQTPMLAVDLGGDGEASFGIAPRVFGDTTKFDVERNRMRLSADAQVPVNLEVGTAVIAADACAFEGHLRMVVHVKKVSTAEVTIALLVARTDAAYIR